MKNFLKNVIMDHDQKWIVVRIDGKVAAISTGYAALAAIAQRLAQQKNVAHRNICAETVGFDEVWRLRQTLRWEDLVLTGTDFQKKVWRMLFEPPCSNPISVDNNLSRNSDAGIQA